MTHCRHCRILLNPFCAHWLEAESGCWRPQVKHICQLLALPEARERAREREGGREKAGVVATIAFHFCRKSSPCWMCLTNFVGIRPWQHECGVANAHNCKVVGQVLSHTQQAKLGLARALVVTYSDQTILAFCSASGLRRPIQMCSFCTSQQCHMMFGPEFYVSKV